MSIVNILRSEFSLIRSPDEARILCSQAVPFLNSDKLFSVDSKTDPIIKAVCSILKCFKKIKRIGVLFSLILEGISSRFFKENALCSLLESIVEYLNIFDDDCLLKLLQHVLSDLLTNFPCYSIFQPYFSIAFTLVGSNNAIISSTATATVQQMMNLLIVETLSFVPSADRSSSFIHSFNESHVNLSNSFDNHMYYVLFLLFSDIASLCINGKTKWLCISANVDSAIVIEMLEILTVSYASSLEAIPQICSIFDGTLIQVMNNDNYIHFVIGFISSFYRSKPSLCNSVLLDFLSRLLNRGRINEITLYFFFSIFVNKNNTSSLVLLNSDSNFYFSHQFIKSIDQILKKAEPSQAIDCPIKQFKLNISKDPNRNIIEIQSLITIVLSIVTSLYNNYDKNFYPLIKQNEEELFSILLLSLQYSSFKSFLLIIEALYQLLELFSWYNNNVFLEFSLKQLLVFDSLPFLVDMKENDCHKYYINEKRDFWGNFLLKLVNDHSKVCSNHFFLVFSRLFEIEKKEINLAFTRGLTIPEQIKALQSLFQLNPVPIEFIISLINTDSGMGVQAIAKITDMINLSVPDDTIILLFPAIIKHCFNQDTMKVFFESCAQLVSNESIPVPYRNCIIQSITDVIEQFSIEDEVYLLLKIIDDVQNVELYDSSYLLLNSVSRDILSNDNISAIICTTKQFLSKPNIYDSLFVSLLQLFSIYSRCFGATESNWNQFVSVFINIIIEKHPNVSAKAQEILFSIILTNKVPISILEYLYKDGFPLLLDSLNSENHQKVIIQLFINIVDFAKRYWCEGLSIELLKKVVLSQVILFKELKDNEIFKSFQIYITLLSIESSVIESIVTSAFETITNHLIVNKKHSYIEATVKLIKKALLQLRPRFSNGASSPSEWFSILITLSSESFSLNPHPAVEIISLTPILYPLPDDASCLIIKTLISIALSSTIESIIECCIENLSTIFKQKIPNEKSISYILEFPSIVKIPQSSKLLQIITSIHLNKTHEIDRMIGVLSSISYYHPHLALESNISIARIIGFLNESTINTFLIDHGNQIEVLQVFWQSFISDKSLSVPQSSYNLAVSALKNLLMSTNEEVIILTLQFLVKSLSPTKVINGVNSNYSHLLRIFNEISHHVKSSARIRIHLCPVLNIISTLLSK